MILKVIISVNIVFVLVYGKKAFKVSTKLDWTKENVFANFYDTENLRITNSKITNIIPKKGVRKFLRVAGTV